jgi:YegS/Rv2252/BmrU family lipid kinase
MRVFVILNPVAGRNSAAHVRTALRRYFDDKADWQFELYETTGTEDVAAVVRGQIDNGVEAVFAAGGDGTVSAVVDAIVHSHIPLGIIPTGTTNVLAQELGIPLNIDKACRLLAGEPERRSIDALLYDEHYYVLSVGTGLGALVMKGTSRKGKQRFGLLAYVWSFIQVIAGLQPHTFTIVADGKSKKVRAADVLLANVSLLTRPFRWGPHIRPDDGRIDICIMRARNIVDIVGVMLDIIIPGRRRRDRGMQYLSAQHTILITSEEPIRVQGDGELLGYTPLEVVIVPEAIQVFVPVKANRDTWLRLPSFINSS